MLLAGFVLLLLSSELDIGAGNVLGDLPCEDWTLAARMSDIVSGGGKKKEGSVFVGIKERSNYFGITTTNDLVLYNFYIHLPNHIRVQYIDSCFLWMLAMCMHIRYMLREQLIHVLVR